MKSSLHISLSLVLPEQKLTDLDFVPEFYFLSNEGWAYEAAAFTLPAVTTTSPQAQTCRQCPLPSPRQSRLFPTPTLCFCIIRIAQGDLSDISKARFPSPSLGSLMDSCLPHLSCLVHLKTLLTYVPDIVLKGCVITRAQSFG